MVSYVNPSSKREYCFLKPHGELLLLIKTITFILISYPSLRKFISNGPQVVETELIYF